MLWSQNECLIFNCTECDTRFGKFAPIERKASHTKSLPCDLFNTHRAHSEGTFGCACPALIAAFWCPVRLVDSLSYLKAKSLLSVLSPLRTRFPPAIETRRPPVVSVRVCCDSLKENFTKAHYFWQWWCCFFSPLSPLFSSRPGKIRPRLPLRFRSSSKSTVPDQQQHNTSGRTWVQSEIGFKLSTCYCFKL